MYTPTRKLIVSLLSIGSILFCTVGSVQADALPAGSVVEGKTLGEWSAEWWQWALSYPVSNNPLLDTTGSSASLGDVGPVFFLAGRAFSSGIVNRTFAVPAGKFIFFPLINSFSSEEGTVTEMRAALATFAANTTELHASVDGVAIPDLFSHRELSPVFDITLPPDNIFGADPRVYSPSVSDGYWLMLEPLSPGNHIINFGGTSGDFSLDVTYATPEPSSFMLSLCAGAALALGLVRRRAMRRGAGGTQGDRG